MQKYIENQRELFNKLPNPTWKRIRLDNFSFPNNVDYTKDYLKIEEQLPAGVKLNKITEKIDDIMLDYLHVQEYKGVGEKFIAFSEGFSNSGITLYISKNTKINKPIRIEFNLDNENPVLIDHNIIVSESGSESTIVFDYSSNNEIEAFHNGLTKVYAMENSVVNIIKIQNLNHNSYNFDSNVAYVKGRGKVNWISVEIGSSISSSNHTTYLENEGSESNLSSIYLGDGSRKMDLEYSMIHKGPRSISNIETRGVLMDNSMKVFRGNLDFKKGARRSKGVEEEYVILLDPTVKSHSIPALLCEEDDVEGEHAASAGQIDENKLFYLMSRGLSEREAKKLIVEASFRPIVDRIPLEDLRQTINDEIERRLLNE